MIAFAAGYLFKAGLSDMLPFVWCGLILLLYVLSFGRLLNSIDILLPAIAVSLVLVIIFCKDKLEFLQYVIDNIVAAPFATYCVLGIAIPMCVSSKIVTWWDDINYWASDLKSIYYLNGFASKYANVSPAFGDYPPGIQLAKWFVLHFDKHDFREELAFVGFYLFNMALLMPLLGKLKGKIGVALSLPLAIIVWMLPGIAEIYGYYGFCADLAMALLYGNILIATVDMDDNRSKGFDLARVGLYLSVLVIAKSTGAIWALFGIIIWVGYRTLCADSSIPVIKRLLSRIVIAVPPLVVGGSWMLFCLMRRRVTQTTSTMVTYITTDKYGLSEYTGQFASAFAKAFMLEPLHVKRGILNPSPALMIVLIVVALIVLLKKEYLLGRQGRYLAIVVPILGVIYYVFIFICHITIFGTETQYLESSAMIASIERYGAPFMLGVLILIIWLWMQKIDEQNIRSVMLHVGVLCVSVILLGSLKSSYDGLVGYRQSLDEEKAIREGFMDEEATAFVDATYSLPIGCGRVCRLHDGGYYRVADTYIGYEVSPVSVLNISFDLGSVDLGTLISAINQTHATYLYVDEQSVSSDNILNECVSEGDLEYRKLYIISYEDGGMVLYPYKMR